MATPKIDRRTREDEQGALGARLRAIRKAKGLSAKDVAERAGVTAAYVSRLENGRMSPTVTSLSRIAQAVGESVGALFEPDSDAQGAVVRSADRRLVRNHGVEDFRLTPDWAERLEVLETVIFPGRGSGDRPYSHPGDQECVVVLEGNLNMILDDVEHRLEPGDSITFDPKGPHSWTNPGDSQTRTIWIVTPGGY